MHSSGMPFAATTSGYTKSTWAAPAISPQSACSASPSSWPTKPAPDCACSIPSGRSVMDPQLLVDRRRLRDLLDLRPDWKHKDFADALGRSLSWVKKWTKRLRQAVPD